MVRLRLLLLVSGLPSDFPLVLSAFWGPTWTLLGLTWSLLTPMGAWVLRTFGRVGSTFVGSGLLFAVSASSFAAWGPPGLSSGLLACRGTQVRSTFRRVGSTFARVGSTFSNFWRFFGPRGVHLGSFGTYVRPLDLQRSAGPVYFWSGRVYFCLGRVYFYIFWLFGWFSWDPPGPR